MDIKSAKYQKSVVTEEVSCINVLLNNDDTISISVPIDPNNTDYAEIMRQVEAGKLTIQEADSE
tara:strand:- start:37 stop:228 length:192 start_codon:yes stop_codon:yes gene_type:complete